jgi:signal transduction histidine kinase
MTTDDDLVAQLAAHRTLGAAPRHELEWIVAHASRRRYAVGDLVFRKGEGIPEMAIVLSGRATMPVDRGTGRLHVLETRAGDVTALLPFSRGRMAIGDVMVEEPIDALFVHGDLFPEMIRECPGVVAEVVHAMIDRARAFTSTTWQDEKILSLGRLAAGLAHELNNPASAAFRSAELLDDALNRLSEAARSLGMAGLTAAQLGSAVRLRDRSLMRPTTGVFSALERADREDDIAQWLEQHDADVAPAAALAESGVTTAMLEDVLEDLEASSLDAVLAWVAAEFSARSLTIDVRRASRRIHELVSAVKRFTFVDRAPTSAADVGQGLVDTVAVLAHKAKAKSIGITLDVLPELPRIPAFAGELNQVWANLIENALDAAPEGGQVSVSAGTDRGSMVVRVIDNGPGIAPDVEPRIFDPFFTTKPIGQGTGLGLDIARRIVRGHAGQITVNAQPGRTEFRVTLPLTATSPAASSLPVQE